MQKVGPDGQKADDSREAEAGAAVTPDAGDGVAAVEVGGGANELRDEGYRVRVAQFEGPLDLLLHLVRTNEIEITDIPIVTITEQYNEYLQLMRDFDLAVAGEYLVMAATLMHIKSRMLLPPDPEVAGEEDGEDPRAELAQQLLEYQRFKQAAENLQALDSRRTLIWNRDSIPVEFRDEELLSVDMVDLMKAFRTLLQRLGDDATRQIKRDTVSVADKITWLRELIGRRRSIELGELLADLPTRLDRIATFLAVLEMMRMQLLVAFQRKLLGEIRIVRMDPPADSGPAASNAGSVEFVAEVPQEESGKDEMDQEVQSGDEDLAG